MTIVLAVVVGILFACGLYLMMRRTLVKLLLGLALIGNAANLMIFVSAGLTRGAPPLIGAGETAPPKTYADPLAQALILTAIVIGFGVLAFTLALVRRTYQVTKTDDLNELTTTDR
ncbi:MAG: Na+/H+ antiporter subunit C [Fimbriimonadaceae bacterium]|nr:Na+/H+ antiporter subunit C [Fimbriimonadaceae bacterium]